MSNTRKEIFVVLGMHRSGTSTAMSALSSMGINIGSAFHPAGQDNPKGFFEDKDLNSLNIEMLDHIGQTWSSLSLIEEKDVIELQKVGYLEKAKNILLGKISAYGNFGFKDPRTSKLIKFWLKVFGSLDVKVNYLLCMRNPLSVAHSVNKRNKIDLRKAYMLWLSYNLTVIEEISPYAVTVIDYDGLVEQPKNEMAHIAKCLEIDYQNSMEESFSKDFLDGNLRHTKFDFLSIELDSNCTKEIISLYKHIKSKKEFGKKTVIARIFPAREIARINSLFSYIDAIDSEAVNNRVDTEYLQLTLNQLSDYKKSNEKKDSLISALNDKIVEVSNWANNLNDTIEQNIKRISSLNADIETLSIFSQSQTDQIIIRDNKILELNSEAIKVSNWAKKLENDVLLRDKEISKLQISINELSAWGSKLDLEVQKRDNIIMDLNHKIAESGVIKENLTADALQREGEISRLQLSINELSKCSSDLNTAIQDRDATILSLNEKLEQVSKWAADLSVNIDLRDNEVLKLKTKVDELSAWGLGLNEEIHNRDNTILQLNEKIVQVSKWAAELSVDIGLRDNEVLKLKNNVDELSAWGHGLNEKILSLNYENEALSEKLLFSVKSNEILNANLNALNTEFEKNKHDLNEATMILSDIYTKIAETEKENQRLITELDNSKILAVQLQTNHEQSAIHYAQLISDLEKKVEDISAQLQSKQDELLTLSAWAKSIHDKPILYAVKKYIIKLARFIFKSLPVSVQHKQKIRSLIQRKSYKVDSTSLRNQLSNAPAINEPINSVGAFSEKDVFVFAVIDWHFRIQRPQHIAKGLARSGKRVFYFSNHFCDSSTPGYTIEKLDANLELYQVKLNIVGAPAIYFAPPTEEAQKMLHASMAVFISEQNSLGNISVLQHAYWYDLAKKLPNSIMAYDCMDHHEGFGNVPEELINIEKSMLKESDLLIVTSGWLEDFAKDYNSNFVTVRNACEYEHFSATPTTQYQDSKNRRIIGYYGAIAEWFDVDLLRDIATHFKDHLVLMVGADTANVASQVADLDNIVFTGEVPYSTLPHYLYSFDVCLLPFKVIPLTLATNPVKVYEYLSAGKPVVCVDLPEIKQFGDLVYKAGSSAEFLRRTEEALSCTSNAPKLVTARKKFASEQTWDHRAAMINQALANLALPKISVIVLTYNNLDLTKACLESLYQNSMYPNLEIIIVDNASTDDTPTFLREFSKQQPRAKIILNEENLGFSAGNNVGLNAATGDYLVILNNDTYVTPGWALTLMNHLRRDKSVGIIGPVTNNIGNEAKISIEYDSMASMTQQARAYTLSHMGEKIFIKTVAFFCVMLPRSTFDEVGTMDEKFGRGFFEDDDYCRRIEKINKKVACADDVFIHHHLSASFNKLGAEVKQKLFEENKKYYELKWGTWVPHKYR